MYRILILLTIALSFLGMARVWAVPKIKVGQPFPYLVLPTLADGEAMSIRDFQGKKTILHIFASW